MPGNSCPDVTLEIPGSKFTLLTFTKFESRFLHRYCFDLKNIYGGGIQGIFWPKKKFSTQSAILAKISSKMPQNASFAYDQNAPPFIFFEKKFFFLGGRFFFSNLNFLNDDITS